MPTVILRNMSASKVSTPSYKVWKVVYTLPVGGSARYAGCTTSERIFKECQRIREWDTEEFDIYNNLDNLQSRKTSEYCPRHGEKYILEEWCSWWINDRTCKLDERGEDPKSNVQVGLYCALLRHRKVFMFMAMKSGIESSRSMKWYAKELNDRLDEFEVVRDAGPEAVRAKHIHNFGRKELDVGKELTQEDVKKYLEEILEAYEKKDNNDEDSNYVYAKSG